MKKIFLLFLFFAFLPLAAAQIVQQKTLNEGDPNCPTGGIAVMVGENTDSNEALEGNEIQAVAYVCKGEKGCDVVVTTSVPSNSYPECTVGSTQRLGILISSGVDCDSDGNIDDGESTDAVLCRGSKGTNGSYSAQGGGTDDGADGEDGTAAEFVLTEEPAGENCKEGGMKVENRFDANGNGSFEDSEISVNYICNGESPQGGKGEQGRQGLAGMDGNNGADGAKGERGDKGEQGEQGIPGEPGEAGSDGYDSLLSVIDEPAGDNCENGGKKFLSGIDADRNGVLDESEIKNSYFICNGENAAEASEQAASSGCSVSSIDDNPGFYSLISNICRFVSDLF